ncbi:hypothetical protein F8M41_012935 [Gigaspora margarita]|uniref:Uncharacterized protein n=1 Tax=Gigaspora margarita TaxID=4874 RepID=A0A8H3X0C6_GIGMA|nr:hypothetical protein F8M41_012935 [Gigaspora margarita]
MPKVPKTNAGEFTTQRRRCSRTNTREFITVPKVKCRRSPHNVQEHQRIHHSAKSAKGQMPENSSPNAEGVQELTSMKSPHSAKKCERTKCRRIYYTTPKVFKGKH